MLMLHRLARSGDIPLPTPPSEALDCNSPPITNETCFRIGKAGGAVSTASSSRSDREHALRTPATKPTTAPTRLKTFLKILNKPTRHSSPLTIDIPPSSPIRPATVQSTPIYDRFAGTASQEDQHKSTTTPGVPTSAYEEDVEPPHLCSNKASVEKHEMHPTSLTPLHDEDFDSVSNYSTDLGGEVVAAPPAHGSAALSTPPRPPTSSTSTSCRFERNSESVSESAGSHSDAKNDSVEGNDGKRNSDELSYSTDYHWDARSLVLLRVLLRTGRCQVGRSSEVRELRSAQQAIDRMNGFKNRSSGEDLSFLEDEPPPPPLGSSSVRPSWGVARRTSSGTSGRESSDEVALSRGPSVTLPTQRASVGSVGLTFPNASRPFPSRKPRPQSELRRSSSDKKTSPTAVSLNAFGRPGHATSPPSPARTASSSSESEEDELPLSNTHLSSVEQRINLAAYLDETAEAMEGGKSLAMAHEELRTCSESRRPSRDFQAALEAQEAQKAAEQQNKRAEKRRRTIKELCDTERVYASDLAVLRDIFLRRARGAEMSAIADHVMTSGLGLFRIGEDEERFPPFTPTWTRTSRSRQTSFTRSSVADKLERRRQTSTAQPLEYVEDAVMSSRDIYTIFINLEEIVDLAEGFSAALDAAQGVDREDARDDRIGEVFVDMLPRIKQVYSTYCARHHRAIIRLQELEPTLRTYFSECRALSHGRTSAWDLASLLIKPVQRCLKYPLLLEQILAVTPTNHPDRPSLVVALKTMLLTAEHINDYKKRTDKVENVLASKRGPHSHSRDTSFSLSKKLLRSAPKSKPTSNFTDQDELFDTLAALVETTRAGVLRLSSEMKDWSRMTKCALEAQVTMVSGWIDLYAPIGDEMHPHPSHRRLEVFLDDVLVPLIEGPFRELDHEIRRSLVSKTDHLLSIFENPLQVIKRRNEHKAEHRRYITRKMPQDQRGSDDYVTLTTQLLEEVPKFLASVSKYFNIVVSAFTNVQHIYQDSVRERWEAYADEWLTQIPKGDYAAIEAAFQDASRDVTQMLASIVKGLNLSVVTAGTMQRRSKNARGNPGRDSLHSTSSSSSNTTPVMSPRGRFSRAEATSFEDYSMSASVQRISSGYSNGNLPSSPSAGRPSLRRHETSSATLRRAKDHSLPPLPPMPTTSSSLISNYFDNVSEQDDHDDDVDRDSMQQILYRAEAIASSCSSAYRSGYPLLSFIEGDQVDVELEEADSEQGGAGWLLARDVEGVLGWCRTEDFIVVE